MSDATTDAFQSKIDALRRRFGERLQDNVRELATLIADFSVDGNHDESREKIRRLSHSLAGVAGTIGFYEISDAGADLENAILDHAPDDRICALAQSTIETINGQITPA